MIASTFSLSGIRFEIEHNPAPNPAAFHVPPSEPMARNFRWSAPAAFLLVALALTAADAPPEIVTIVDGDDKEIKLGGVKYTLGVRRLAWLGDASAATDDGKKGPWAFEIREPDSTLYQKGVITLVPMASIEGVKYDYTNFTAAIAVKGLKDPVMGTTKYKGFCFLGVEGEAGGVKAKLTGGELSKAKTGPRTGFKSIAFPQAKPLPPRAANAPGWAITLEDAKPADRPHIVRNLKALYQFSGGVEQISDLLPARKGEPVVLGTGDKPSPYKKIEVIAVDPTNRTLVLELDSGERTVVIPTGELDKKPATLVGFLGEVDAGWKLFPLHAIGEMTPAK